MCKREAPLASSRTSDKNRTAVGSLDSACEEHACTGSFMRQGRERSALVAASFSMTTSLCAPTQVEHSLLATAQHWIWGSQNQGKDPTVGHRAAAVGVYSRRISEDRSLMVATPTQLTSQYTLRVRGAGPQQGVRGWGYRMLRAVISCERQMELEPKAASEHSCGCLNKKRISPMSAHGPHLHSPLDRGPVHGGEKNILKGNRASFSPTLRGSALATWDQTLPPTGQ